MVNCGCDARGYQSLGWAIRRISDGVYVGKCDAQVTANSVATNVGYLLFPAFWRQGYATEAVRAIVAELVRRGTADMHACVTKGNDASERVLSKVGFTRARVLPNNDTIRGVLCDEIEYVRRAVPR